MRTAVAVSFGTNYQLLSGRPHSSDFVEKSLKVVGGGGREEGRERWFYIQSH